MITAERLTYLTTIVCFFLFTLWQCESNKSDKLMRELENSRLKQEIRELQAAKDSASAQEARLSVKAKKDSSRFIVVLTRNEGQTRALKSRLAEAREKIASLSDSVAPVATFLNLCDSTVAKLDSAVAGLKIDRQRVYDDFNVRLKLKEDEIQAQKQIAEVWEKSAVSNDKRAKKLDRRRKFWRTTTVILTAGLAGVFLASQ